MALKTNCFTINSYNQAFEIISICKEKNAVPILFIKYFLISGPFTTPKEWFKVFPKEQFHFVPTDNMSDDVAIQKTVTKVFKFLGLPDYEITEFGRNVREQFSNGLGRRFLFLLNFLVADSRFLDKP